MAGALSRDPEIISIHALREEGDKLQQAMDAALKDFYPRPPRGGRRGCRKPARPRTGISIHALREEGDWVALPNR